MHAGLHSAASMAKRKAAEPGPKQGAGTGLQRVAKARRMMGDVADVEDGNLRVAQVGRTVRERSLNREKEKQRRKAEEEKMQEARRLVREAALRKVERARRKKCTRPER